MAAITANGITIEVERHGPESGTPLLLIRGLGSQIIHWPKALIDGFVAAGFHVIAYDNRDAGLSQKFDDWGVPGFDVPKDGLAFGAPSGAPYTIDDMVADGIGVLDTLGIRRAHVLGISMGGMILQAMARTHPDRLCSATVVMSTSGAGDLPMRSPEIQALLLARPDDPTDRAQVIEHTLKCDHVWGSPGFPFDEAERRALIGWAFDRCYCQDGVDRQFAATLAGRDQSGLLDQIRVPTLVIHGTDDVLLPVEHGRDIARRIPGASLVEIAGMGHDLDGGVAPVIVEAAVRHMREAAVAS